jgi:hypothetical protein
VASHAGISDRGAGDNGVGVRGQGGVALRGQGLRVALVTTVEQGVTHEGRDCQ